MTDPKKTPSTLDGTEPVPTTLDRIAACVPVLVEAGCEGPDGALLEHGALCVSDQAAPTRSRKLITPFLKVWFRETVVPHFSPAMYELDPPFYDSDDGRWYWGVHEDSGWCLDPTESFVQCLEALCEVVKAGAQEAEGESGGGA